MAPQAAVQVCCGVKWQSRFVVVWSDSPGMLWCEVTVHVCCGVKWQSRFVVVWSDSPGLLWCELTVQQARFFVLLRHVRIKISIFFVVPLSRSKTKDDIKREIKKCLTFIAYLYEY